MPERQTKNKSRDDRNFIGFKNVSSHTSTVANIIADQVSNHGWISRIILRDACFYFTNQISADVCCFGEDTTTHAHEQRQQRSTETETKQSIGSCNTQDHKDDRTAQQTETISQHACNRTGAISDTKRFTK